MRANEYYSCPLRIARTLFQLQYGAEQSQARTKDLEKGQIEYGRLAGDRCTDLGLVCPHYREVRVLSHWCKKS